MTAQTEAPEAKTAELGKARIGDEQVGNNRLQQFVCGLQRRNGGDKVTLIREDPLEPRPLEIIGVDEHKQRRH